MTIKRINSVAQLLRDAWLGGLDAPDTTRLVETDYGRLRGRHYESLLEARATNFAYFDARLNAVMTACIAMGKCRKD